MFFYSLIDYLVHMQVKHFQSRQRGKLWNTLEQGSVKNLKNVDIEIGLKNFKERLTNGAHFTKVPMLIL